MTDRIVSIARAEAANSGRNRESGTNCNYYSGALGAGSPCANGWRAQEWCADFARWVWGQAGARTAGLSGAAGSFAGYGTYRSGAAASNARPATPSSSTTTAGDTHPTSASSPE